MAGPERDATDTPPPGAAGATLAWKELAAVAAVVAVLTGGGTWWLRSRGAPNSESSPRSASTAASNYVGNLVCRACHPGEVALHSASGHAHTLRSAGRGELARWLDGRSVHDPEFPGAVWTYHLQEGRLTADRTETASDQQARWVLDYAFGSGQHATTFVSLMGLDPAGRPLVREHRLTVFADRAGLDVTPGQRAQTHAPGRGPEGRAITADETRMCFECHSTRLGRVDPRNLDPATMLPNVSCERCHGPGRAHVAAARRGDDRLTMPFGLDRTESAEAEVRLCGACHRLPEFVPDAELRPENPVLPRFQSIGLMQSKCFLHGEGRLRCTTCHDPHARAARGAAAYEPQCLSCHRDAPQTRCSVSPRADCLGCHMPRRDAGNGMIFSDHWIRINTP